MSEREATIQFDTTFVPRRRRDLAFENLDGEVVIWDPQATSLYVLNPSATMVWVGIDGSTSVESLARELGEIFGVNQDQIEVDVLQIIREFDEQGLLDMGGGPGATVDAPAPTAGDHEVREVSPETESAGGPRLLPQASTGCNAQALDQLGWAGHVTVLLGEWLVNVRANTPHALDMISAYLEPHVVPTVDGTCQYSVVLEPRDSGTNSLSQPLSMLYRGTCAVLRSSHPAEVLGGLGTYLSEHALSDRALLRVRSTVLIRDSGSAVLLPESLRREVALRERRLADGGLRLAHHAVGVLIPGTSKLELRADGIENVTQILQSLDPVGARKLEERGELIGRYPIRTCVVFGGGTSYSRLRSAEAVRRLSTMIDPVSEGDRRTLFETLTMIARSADIRTVGDGSHRTVLDRLMGVERSTTPL